MARIQIKRVYETQGTKDGLRLLVDRVWPRGVTKRSVRADAWLKNVAPSAGLRKWFNHDPAKWSEFKIRYFRELDRKPEDVSLLIDALGKGPVTLLYSAKDSDRNQAVALKEYLSRRLGNG